MTASRPGHLVVLGSTLTALAILRSPRPSGLKLWVLDDRAGPAFQSRLASARRLPSMTPGHVVAELQRIGRMDELAVIADSDRWLRFLQEHGDELRRLGLTVLHPGSETLAVCLDKSRFLDWCLDRGIPAPRRYRIESFGGGHAEPAYPLLLRPEQTQHSSGARVPKAQEVLNAAQLAAALERFHAAGVVPSICDSLLTPGLRQFSVGAATDRLGRTVTFLGEKVRPPAERCAGGTFVAPAVAPEIEALAARVLAELEHFGLAEVEIMHDPATSRSSVIEVNARPWLQCSLPPRCGCDLLAHVLDHRPADERRIDRRHAWLYFWPDLRTCFSPEDGVVRRGRLSWSDYARTLLAADVYPLWSWRDPRPLLSSAMARALRRPQGRGLR